MTRRIIDELFLSHIAAVDAPAQEGALAMVIKRRPDESECVSVSKAAPKSGGEDGDLDEEIEAIMTAEKCSKATAMERLAKSKPQLVAAAQSAPVEKARPFFEVDESFASPVRKAAVAKFSELVEGVAARSGLAKHVALDRARVAYPQEFAAAYG